MKQRQLLPCGKPVGPQKIDMSALARRVRVPGETLGRVLKRPYREE